MKKHYKMYKAGKKWVFAAISVFAIGTTTFSSFDASVDAKSNTKTTKVSKTKKHKVKKQSAKTEAAQEKKLQKLLNSYKGKKITTKKIKK